VIQAHFYVEALRKHKIQWMTVCRFLLFLANFILDAGLKFTIKSSVTTSEKLTSEMREVMKRHTIAASTKSYAQ
jgi:hypothetical protein